MDSSEQIPGKAPRAPSKAPDGLGSGDRQMTASPRLLINQDDGSEVLWNDGERLFRRERRPNADGKLESVLIVSLIADHPTSGSVDRLTHEYALRNELDSGWAARPLELIRQHGRTSLMLEDS